MNDPVSAVPSIWPLGHGCVMTSFAIPEGKPLFFFRAVRDELVGQPGQSATMDAWKACEGAPTLTLAFADRAAIKRLVCDLEELAAALPTEQPPAPQSTDDREDVTQ